jgi:hypothetical protein
MMGTEKTFNHAVSVMENPAFVESAHTLCAPWKLEAMENISNDFSNKTNKLHDNQITWP